MAKFKIELYNSENIRNLLQETYMLADEQLIQAQNEINKLANATRLQDEVMESKAKYAKAMNDYMGVKDKAISKKMEIAKLLSELLNSYKNNSQGITDASGGVKQTFDLTKIKEMVKNMHDDKEKTKTIELTKK
jgi:hypothetical protein